jgi:protoporphyrinogen oxidase
MNPDRDPIVAIGAGPAGLTAAYQLVKANQPVVVLESDLTVGGISRTVEQDGWRFDIGGHRFFTKVPEVEALWHEILPEEDFPLRPRMSRIYTKGKFFNYPLKAWNALSNLGPYEALACMSSYLWAKLHPPKDQSTFEGWTAARFGWRLYRTFFKSYTEKVWGVPADQIQADWAAQRVKNLSLWKAVKDALFPWASRETVTSLIEKFHYPRLGPGMMWEKASEIVQSKGGTLLLGARVTTLAQEGEKILVSFERLDPATGQRQPESILATHVVSSMPLKDLVLALRPEVPREVREAALGLSYRDFLTVALVVPEEIGFPDNWIYVHDPNVRLGRIQNFGSWSPDMVRPGWTCLGLEYFVFEGDELWEMSDAELTELGRRELSAIGLMDEDVVKSAYVVRMPKAYPVYDEGYQERIATIRGYLEASWPHLQVVGRNGMHRYNNQDHSMLTAMLAVENILGANHDLWSVNVEEDYHEEVSQPSGKSAFPGSAGTGRSAPVLPRRA